MAKLLVFLAICCVAILCVTAFECDDEDEFECGDGTCIAIGKRCDGSNDCPDRSDERGCANTKCEPPLWHLCADNRTCIDADSVCDDIENCPGGDDERHCSGRSLTHESCNKFEFTCEDQSCIPLDLMCNGKEDCDDGSDETMGCEKAELSCPGFFCANKKCLESHLWVCDGVDDCGDGSDEVGCVWNCKVELQKFLCKDNDTCISLDQVCDGHKDCSDESDENGLCKNPRNNCDSMKCPKESKCQNLPSGGVCVCSAGFQYNATTNACEDINECDRWGICSQGCTNSYGSYICTCAEKFALQSDGRSCKVKSGEGFLLYTTQKSVVGVYLQSRHIYKVADNLAQVIGVTYDGEHIYCTNIQRESESIMKARVDGSKQEVLLTSGLDAPEDLAIDWLTGNIYFSDNIQRHIAVCSNDGHVCTVLVVIDVHQPRGIALHPTQGRMFWSDWGSRPMIATAFMDGSDHRPLVTADISWPNGVTLDIPNDRVYWVDAKRTTIESVRMDGSDRRRLLTDILKHPYGISVFEDNIYWSDWETKSIHTCHKFTGKGHEVVAKDRTIYAVHVYHSALQPKRENPCSADHGCSHMCLLAGNASWSCACPDGMALGADQHKCIRSAKKQKLFLAVKNYIQEVEHSAFGRHRVVEEYPMPFDIDGIEYNSVNRTIFVASNDLKTIYEFDLRTKSRKVLIDKNIENVAAMSFDYLTQNLYWADSKRHTIEVLSLRNRQRAIVHFFTGLDSPIALSVIPDIGKMFIALQSASHVHIDQQELHGSGNHHHAFEDKLGDEGIFMLTDFDTNTLYWVDTESGVIEFSVVEKMQRFPLRSRLPQPVSMAIVDDEIFWSVRNSPMVYWVHKSNLGPIKKFEAESPAGSYYSTTPDRIRMLASSIAPKATHKCLQNNGGCSHVCVSVGKFDAACLCPPALVFKDATNRTCIEALDCEFRCRSGECLTTSRRCNGHKECADGSDEENCQAKTSKPKLCALDEFACHDGSQCVPNEARCDKNEDCKDKSDEDGCEHFDHSKKCHTHQHTCDNGRCVDLTALCDGFDDCGDDSDEQHCMEATAAKSDLCGKDMFRCTIGTCIPKSWECDGKLDCKDGSDEHDRCARPKCPKGYRTCKHGVCIDEKLFCDGHDDCGDASDEKDCSEAVRKIACGDDMDDSGEMTKFQCTSQPTLCLDIKAKCNGTAECPRGEDEIGCSGCSLYQFQCKTSKECVVVDWRCDGHDDCRDGSDELNCQTYHNSSTHGQFAMACEPGMFDCHDGTCIAEARVCDGSADCDNSSDETNLCLTACKQSPCQHKCKATPLGAICSCRNGYQLNGDKLTCQDVNECEESHACAQLCQNTVGAYRCGCYADFLLRADKTSCKSLQSEHFVLFSTFNQIRQLTPNPPSLSVLVSANESRIAGMDVNVKQLKLYYTTLDGDSIVEFDMATKNVTNTLMAESRDKIAADWVTGNVYSISRGDVDYVQVCDMRKGCAKLLKSRRREVVKDIAVDAANRKLFYSTVVSGNLGPPKTTIYVSGLDGSKKEVLLQKVGYVVAIEADVYKQELIFVDRHSKTVQSIRYSKVGATPKYLVRKEDAITNPSDVSVYENEAFLTNMGAKEALRCKLYGDMKCESFELNVYNAEDIVVVAPSRQKSALNVCEKSQCAVVCVPAELGSKCLCPDGSTMPSGVACPKDATMAEHYIETKSTETLAVSSAMSAGAVTAICFTILLVILLGLLGYMFYRRKRETGNFKFNMHFQNPLSWKSASAGRGGSDEGPGRGGGGGNRHQSGSRKIEICRPIQRFFSDAKGSELFLETAKRESTPLQPVRFSARQASILLEDSSDNDSARDLGNFEDDPRAQLVL